MPNHITNVLKASPHVLTSLKSEELAVDFNTLVPQPPELMKESVCMSATYMANMVDERIDLKKMTDEDFASVTSSREALLTCLLGKIDLETLAGNQDFKNFEELVKCLNSVRKTGYTYWYEWNIANWGTKWGAYDAAQNSDTEVQFDTAWSHPEMIIKKLSEKFPEESIEVEYADEDIGYNLGHYRIQAGVRENLVVEDPILFALRLKGRLTDEGNLHEDEYYRKNPDTGLLEYFDKSEEVAE